MTAIAPYFVGGAALAAGAGTFVASQVMMFLKEGSLSLWLYAVVASLVVTIGAIFGMAVIGIVVFALSYVIPSPRSSIGLALLVGALYAAIGVSLALLVLARAAEPLYVVTVLVGALAGSLGAALATWLVHRRGSALL